MSHTNVRSQQVVHGLDPAAASVRLGSAKAFALRVIRVLCLGAGALASSGEGSRWRVDGARGMMDCVVVRAATAGRQPDRLRDRSSFERAGGHFASDRVRRSAGHVADSLGSTFLRRVHRPLCSRPFDSAQGGRDIHTRGSGLAGFQGKLEG